MGRGEGWGARLGLLRVASAGPSPPLPLLSLAKVDYTLDVYSMAPFKLRALPYRMRHQEAQHGAWRGVTAGGCPNYDTFVDNPRFRLTLGVESDVQVEPARSTWPSHVATSGSLGPHPKARGPVPLLPFRPLPNVALPRCRRLRI